MGSWAELVLGAGWMNALENLETWTTHIGMPTVVAPEEVEIRSRVIRRRVDFGFVEDCEFLGFLT